MGNKDYTEKKHKAHHPDERANTEGMPTVQQLAFTAAGAAGSALLSALLARRGYAPKTVAGALAAIGAGIAGVGHSDAFRALGAGAMSGSSAQLVLMLFAEYEEKKNVAGAAATAVDVMTRSSVTLGDAVPAADAANANVVSLPTKVAAS
jgi:hypothetical protein